MQERGRRGGLCESASRRVRARRGPRSRVGRAAAGRLGLRLGGPPRPFPPQSSPVRWARERGTGAPSVRRRRCSREWFG